MSMCRVLEKFYKRPLSMYAISKSIFIIPACCGVTTQRNKMAIGHRRDM